MITELEIQNFRSFRRLKLEGLRRINLLLGANDTGKTSVLEALTFLLGDNSAVHDLASTFRSSQNFERHQQVNNADDFENFWLWLFRERDLKNSISLKAVTDKGGVVRLISKPDSHPGIEASVEREVAGKPQQMFTISQGRSFNWHGAWPVPELKIARLSVRPTNPVVDAEKYNVVALEPKGERRIEEVMRVIEPRLRRLRYAKLPNTTSPLVFADIGLPRMVPSTQMGQAFNRILHIYCEILSQDANVLLIDEIENGIFTETMPALWQGLLAICEAENVQIFATSHSRECVMAALRAAEERNKDELMVYRLQRVREEVEAVRLEARHLELAAEMGLEVRS